MLIGVPERRIVVGRCRGRALCGRAPRSAFRARLVSAILGCDLFFGLALRFRFHDADGYPKAAAR
jgi:hypothetical protein